MENINEMSQDEIVVELCTNIDTNEYTEEEWEEMYNRLDFNHKLEVDISVRDFADAAVGDEHWDDDD